MTIINALRILYYEHPPKSSNPHLKANNHQKGPSHDGAGPERVHYRRAFAENGGALKSLLTHLQNSAKLPKYTDFKNILTGISFWALGTG